MKKQIVISAVFFTALLFAIPTSASAQDTTNKSNGVLEIISLHLPDSVVFKPADGQVLKSILIYFISEGKQRGVKVEARNVSIDDDWIPSFTDETIVCAMADPGIHAQKIQFTVDNKTVYFYDLLQNEWEPGSAVPNESRGNRRNRR